VVARGLAPRRDAILGGSERERVRETGTEEVAVDF
jgi:hypothetical protein